MPKNIIEKYRASSNMKEIVKILHHSRNDEKAFLWQNIDKKRYIFQLKDLAVNERFNSFQVKVSNADAFVLSSSLPTYAKFSYKETVFKAEPISKISENIALSLPKEIRALELRGESRYKFKPSDQKAISLKVSVELMIGATQEFRFQVIDISSGGLSIVISDRDIKYFEEGSSFELIKLQDDVLNFGYMLEYVYSQKFRFKSHGRTKSAYKVGLKSLVPIKETDLEKFKSNGY